MKFLFKFAVAFSLVFIILPESAFALKVVMSNVEIRGYGGRCLDIRGPSKTDGAKVQIWGCMNVAQQRWNIYDDGTIRSRYSWKCITLRKNINPEHLEVRTCDGSDSQKWQTDAFPTVNTGGKFIRHKHGKCMDVAGPSLNWGTPVQVWNCIGDGSKILDNQSFVAVKTKAGTFSDRWSAATDKAALCYSGSSCSRLKALVAIRETLLKRHYTQFFDVGADHYYFLDHGAIGRVVNDIAVLPGYSTTEKVFVWNTIASRGLKFPSADYPYYFDIEHHRAHRLTINADLLGPANTRAHTVVSFWDDYHGHKVDFTVQDAFNMIWEKENNAKSKALCLPFCPNLGDVSASLRSVIAMQAFQRTNSFQVFADYWNALLREYGSDWCPQPIYANGCSTLNIPVLE